MKGNEAMTENLLDLVREERQRLTDAGEPNSLADAINIVCKRLDICAECKRAGGSVISHWNANTPVIVTCPNCAGTGKFTNPITKKP